MQALKKNPEPGTLSSVTPRIKQAPQLAKKASANASGNKCKGQLFNHLELSSSSMIDMFDTNVHPAFLQLGSQYRSKVIIGSNARCLALMTALKSLILDFETPAKQEFSRSLEGKLLMHLYVA